MKSTIDTNIIKC